MARELKEPAVAYRKGRQGTIIPFSLKERKECGEKAEYAWPAGRKIALISHGFTKTQLEGLKERTGLDYELLSAILGVTKATLHSKKNTERFSAGVSEKIMLLADLYSFGHEMWGDAATFNRWMQTPAYALDDARPVSVINTTYGMQEIRNIIGRMAHGIPT